MRTGGLCACVAGAALMAPLAAPLQAQDAQREMAKGIAAFKNTEYAKAAEHFQAALKWDPQSTQARLYLGTTYMQQFIPGADTADNRALAAAAKEQFEKVLEQEADNEPALTSLGSLAFSQKKLDEAAAWYKRLISVKPDAKEALYTLGVIAWTRSFQAIQDARQKLGMKPEDPGPIADAAVRGELREYRQVIEEGCDYLNTALALDAEYDDAMAYLNLLYRTRAYLEDSSQGYRDDMARADEWFRKLLEIRKAKAERKQ